MTSYSTDDDTEQRALLRDAIVEPHPGEDGFAYAARLLREQARARRSRRVLAVVRVGAALTLAISGVTVF